MKWELSKVFSVPIKIWSEKKKVYKLHFWKLFFTKKPQDNNRRDSALTSVRCQYTSIVHWISHFCNFVPYIRILWSGPFLLSWLPVGLYPLKSTKQSNRSKPFINLKFNRLKSKEGVQTIVYVYNTAKEHQWQRNKGCP